MEDTIKSNLGNLMKEAQKIQEKMLNAQKVLADIRVIGEAGAGLVKVTMNGRHNVIHVYIAPEALKPENHDKLPELIAGAINNAAQKIEKASTQKISEIASNLELPSDFKMPFDDED